MESDGAALAFHPELFEQRSAAMAALASYGIDWFTHYGSVDLLHESYGLEVCGIQQENDADAIVEILRQRFPTWHYQDITLRDWGMEPGWMVRIISHVDRTKGDLSFRVLHGLSRARMRAV